MRRILLTHVHMDHVGSLDVLAEQLNGIEVAVGRRESRFLTRDFHTEPGEATNKVRGSFPKVQTIPSVLLTEGECYGSLKVIATPGHTPGHISVICVEDSGRHVMLAGDATDSLEQLQAVRADAIAPDPKVHVATLQTILAHCAQHPTIYLPSHDPESAARLAGAIQSAETALAV